MNPPSAVSSKRQLRARTMHSGGCSPDGLVDADGLVESLGEERRISRRSRLKRTRQDPGQLMHNLWIPAPMG